jgi:hypothetical protein
MKGLIVNAVRLIEEHGWCQGTAINGQGNLCIAGGLGAASQGIASLKVCATMEPPTFHRHDKVFTETMRYLEERLGMAVPNFNDIPGRKWETIKAILLEAADYLDVVPEQQGRPIKMLTGKKGSFSAHLAEHIASIDKKFKAEISADMYALADVFSPLATATQKASEHGS